MYIYKNSELRRYKYSYEIVRIQRNKYVSFVVIFTFIANLVYFWLKNKRYQLVQLR